MDGVGAARDRRGDDRLFVEVGFRRVRRADLDRFIGEAGGQHLLVGGAHGLHGLDSQRPRRADDPHGDLAAVGDKQLSGSPRGSDLDVIDGLARHHGIFVLDVERDDLAASPRPSRG